MIPVESIGGVIFDFYGTLVEEAADEIRSDRDIFRRYGYELSEPMRRLWIDPVSSLDHAPHSSDRGSYTEFQSNLWRQSLRDAGVADDDLDPLVGHALARSRARRLETFSGVVDTLTIMRESGVRTAVCSNWGWDLTEAVHASGLSGLVDVVVSSAQVGYRKPHGRIFEVALGRLGLTRDSVLFVGDTWSADIEGALAAGLRAAQIVHEDEPPDEEALPPSVVRISTLPELLPFLALPAAFEGRSGTA